MDKTSELLAAAFVKDCSGGDRLMKLNTMEGRLLSRLTTLINQYLHYKNSKGKEIEWWLKIKIKFFDFWECCTPFSYDAETVPDVHPIMHLE